MGGIAGILGRPDVSSLDRMLEMLGHRGPDGKNLWASRDGFALGHLRFATTDLEGPVQPVSNEDGTLWVAMNGEIYNRKALRRWLDERHTFRTQSDAELVLHLFEEEGPRSVRRLDGMFALAIWGPGKGLFLARDPLGIKPLYYGYDRSGNLLFASEIKALLRDVKQIETLPRGTYWTVGKKPTTYYQIPETKSKTVITDERHAAEALDRALNEAVKKQLAAEVPVGLFVSGGLDSSLIGAMAQQYVPGDLHSFAVGLEGSADLINARTVAHHIGTIHHEQVLTPDEIIAALPAVIRTLESYDPALVRSSIPTTYASALASEYIKVVLGGEGADELFAGYQYLEDLVPNRHALLTELNLITSNMHNSALQRLDRIGMSKGLEVRTPFLDPHVVDVAMRIHPSLKWRDGQGKWILRKVAERYLPRSIVWREKEKFAIGTGIGPLLESYANRQTRSMDVPRGWLREEWLYWSLFPKEYRRDDVLKGMGRSRSLNPEQRLEMAKVVGLKK